MSILRTIAMFIYLFGYMILHYGILRRAERAAAAGDTATVEQIVNQHIPRWSRGILKVTGVSLSVDGLENIPKDRPCVILGRCGDYVLRERKDVLRVFVYAPKEWRLEYAKTNPLVKAKDEKGIKDEVEKTDRNRSAYYNYYTQNRWGDAHNYDLAINAALGRETCVKMILDAAAAKEKNLG